MNHQIRLGARPVGLPKASDWTFTEEPIPAPMPGEAVVKLSYLSLDPAMRGWMNDARSYIAPVGIGEVMRAIGVGAIVESRDPALAIGDTVVGAFGAQEYAIARDATKIDLKIAPAPTWLGLLGYPGLTAYFGLLDVGKPVAGQTVVVSAAAGAVGQVVGQLAKLHGCRAVGIAGGPAKCRYLVDTLGLDAAIDYKAEKLGPALRTHCPKGIDVYFDNVGGDPLDAALAQLARGARVVLCGAVSQYNAVGPVRGPANYLSLLVNRASITGMIVFDHAARYGEAIAAMAGWLAAGKLIAREDIVDGGLSLFPDALLRLFRGDNLGKLVLRM